MSTYQVALGTLLQMFSLTQFRSMPMYSFGILCLFLLLKELIRVLNTILVLNTIRVLNTLEISRVNFGQTLLYKRWMNKLYQETR
jgi:hypothetical protein